MKMRFLSCCFAFLIGSSVSLAEHQNPLSKVIDLLSALQAKIVKDGEAEAKAYKDFFEWCDDANRNSGFAIKTAEAKKEKLEASIAKTSSDADVAKAEIEKLAAGIATDVADLKAATQIRVKENADFAKAEQELVESIDTLERAIAIIERQGSSFVQTKVDAANLSTVMQSLTAVLEAASFSSNDRQKLLSLVQQNDDEDADALGAPAPDTYRSHSGGILDVLEDLKEKAEAELSDLRKAEVTAKHNYNMLKQSLEDATTANSKELAGQKADLAAAAEATATATGELANTEKDLANAKETQDTFRADCMEKATDHETTVKGRAEELKVLAKAKKILQEMTAGAEGQTYGAVFLQTASSLSSSSRLHTSADLANMEVVDLVKRLAQEHHSAALAQLASRINAVIRYGAANGDDPFAKVKGLIRDMIERLEQEAKDEADEKAYCDEEMAKTKQKKEELQAEIAKQTAKIDQATARSTSLKDEVAVLQKELADLAKTQAEMDQIRAETNEAFVQAKADLEQGLQGVRAALKVLREYYQNDEAAEGAQDEGSLLQQPAAPEKHSKSTGAGGSIIGILEVVESDFAKNLAEEEAEEAEAQTDYEKTTQENKVTASLKQQDVKYKTKEAAALDKAIGELTSDREGAQSELDAVLEYSAKINDRCIAKPETYEERKRRREAEIAGLKEALAILKGEGAFLQKRSVLRGTSPH